MDKFLTRLLSLCVLANSLVLSSCGGGGSGNSEAVSTNGDGMVFTQFTQDDNLASEVILQSNGKIIVAGISKKWDAPDQLSMARYNSNGSLDTSFGTSGKVFLELEISENFHLKQISMLPNGKILVLANGLTFVRFNANGSLDNSFGTSGISTTSALGSGNSFLVLDNAKILVAGSIANPTTPFFNSSFLLMRFNPNGSIDESFGFLGQVSTEVGTSDEYATHIFLLNENKILLLGNTGVFVAGNALVRYNANGNIDNTFGNNDGIVILNTGGNNATIQPDGKILVAGDYTESVASGWEYNASLARYNTDGSLDTDFGDNGKVLIDTSNEYEEVTSIAVQADGKILIGGSAESEASITGFDFSLLRFESNGLPDLTFGINGKVLTDPAGQYYDQSKSIVLQPNGKILSAGFTEFGTRYLFTLLRYNSDGSLDPSFGEVTDDKPQAPVLTIESEVTESFFPGRYMVTISSTKDGYLDIYGSCNSSMSLGVNEGFNQITFDELPAGTYTDCVIIVSSFEYFIDSEPLEIPTFTVPATATATAP